jgi:hypothetical protein
VEPEQKPKRTRRGSLLATEEPGEQISRDEFQELVADLDVEDKATADAVAGRNPAADLAPEDLVLKEAPKRREKTRRSRNKRHGRSR